MTFICFSSGIIFPEHPPLGWNRSHPINFKRPTVYQNTESKTKAKGCLE